MTLRNLAYRYGWLHGGYNELLSRICRDYHIALAMDIGTSQGNSAIAMADTIGRIGSLLVHTYDVADVMCESHYRPNIVKHVQNLAEPIVAAENEEVCCAAQLAFLDVNPHDGIQEWDIINNVMRPRVTPLLWVFDDVTLTEGMRQFWAKLTQHQKTLDWFSYPKDGNPWAAGGQGLGMAVINNLGGDF